MPTETDCTKRPPYSGAEIALAVPLARAAVEYYRDPANVARFKEWLEARGLPEAEPLTYGAAL